MEQFNSARFQQELLSGDFSFEKLKFQLWEYQRRMNPTIKEYCEYLGKEEIQSIPISFFKDREMRTVPQNSSEVIFESSGTTGQIPSRHFVQDIDWYKQVAELGFFHFFPKKKYKILALLPSYLERGNSSLVYMVQAWMESLGLPGSGFYLNDFDSLQQALQNAKEQAEPILLIGVAFALLDFSEQCSIQLPPDAIVMETGGMKGRKEEIVREELHRKLKEGLRISKVCSEYGMTELLSQAYSLEKGRFFPAPTMQVFVSDIHLNRLMKDTGQSGRLHIVDLANIHSCAFIATDDIGRLHEDGSFEVLGRLDTAEMRGCSLMYG